MSIVALIVAVRVWVWSWSLTRITSSWLRRFPEAVEGLGGIPRPTGPLYGALGPGASIEAGIGG